MSTLKTIDVLKDLYSDLIDGDSKENYAKAVQNAIDLIYYLQENGGMINQLAEFRNRYTPQYSIEFITGPFAQINFNTKQIFETYIGTYASMDEQYVLVGGTTFCTEMYNGIHLFSDSTQRKMMQLLENNV
jgi:hypothetical protein